MLITDEFIEWLGEIYLSLPLEKRNLLSFEKFVEEMIEKYTFNDNYITYSNSNYSLEANYL